MKILKEVLKHDYKLVVDQKNEYGRELFTPVNDMAKGIVALMKCKNFTKEQLKKLQDLGFHIELAPRELKL